MVSWSDWLKEVCHGWIFKSPAKNFEEVPAIFQTNTEDDVSDKRSDVSG